MSHAIGNCQDLIEENSQILASRNRKEKEAGGPVHERNVEVFLDDPEFTTPVNKKSTSCVFFPRHVRELTSHLCNCAEGKKGKGKQFTGHFSAELEAQWAKDRAKKAERKRERQTAQFLAALDPLSADAKGKASGNTGANGHARTSRKAMRAAARLDPSEVLSIAPGAIVDMDSLEAQLRRFVEDVGGRRSMALPPMEKEMRKRVHEMARAFGVKSVSDGHGDRRHTTLFKTSRTRVGGVNEGKVRTLVRRGGAGRPGRGRGQGQGHRDGDEVGKEAPKIGESNIGFRMLASMGWSEGDRIGGTASVGIEAPLTAIIKNTRLGLGATR